MTFATGGGPHAGSQHKMEEQEVPKLTSPTKTVKNKQLETNESNSGKLQTTTEQQQTPCDLRYEDDGKEMYMKQFIYITPSFMRVAQW